MKEHIALGLRIQNFEFGYAAGLAETRRSRLGVAYECKNFNLRF